MVVGEVRVDGGLAEFGVVLDRRFEVIHIGHRIVSSDLLRILNESWRVIYNGNGVSMTARGNEYASYEILQQYLLIWIVRSLGRNNRGSTDCHRILDHPAKISKGSL